MLRATPALLACLRHAASVHPGPGSNPQIVTRTLKVLSLYSPDHKLNVKELMRSSCSAVPLDAEGYLMGQSHQK